MASRLSMHQNHGLYCSLKCGALQRSRPWSKTQNLAKILPTYLDVSGFLDQKVCTDWLMIEEYRHKMGNSFDIKYAKGINQQPISSLDCDHFVATYAEYLRNGLEVPNDGLGTRLLCKIYVAFLWNYGEAKSQKLYANDIKDPR
ncbi:hypothetical protein BC332_10929 [Capsicum chinense]|nr:hypothetical protein BC332_10929 [Capsicum chinense]